MKLQQSLRNGLILALAALTGMFLLPLYRAEAANTAILSASTGSQSVNVGETVIITYLLNSGGQAISAVKAVSSYSSNLQFVSASDSGSVLNMEVSTQTPANNQFIFERLSTGQGYSGFSGILLTATFKALSAGTATVSINQASSEAIDYEQSSNVLASTSGASFTLAAGTSPTANPTAAATSQATPPASGSSPTAAATKSPSPKPAATSKTTPPASIVPTPASAVTATTTPSATASPAIATPRPSGTLRPASLATEKYSPPPLEPASTSSTKGAVAVGTIGLGTIALIASLYVLIKR